MPANKKTTDNLPIEEAALPGRVTIPLQQHLGCPAEPLVKIGDSVTAGQKIADSAKTITAPLHASISGQVVQIARLPNACQYEVDSVVIEGSAENSELRTQNTEHRELENLTPEEIRKIVREAGIVGLGGAAFPTHVKLNPPKDKSIDTVIINGCECEPYITTDHRVMLEKTADVIFGAMAIARAVSASRIIIAVEDNKDDAFQALRSQIDPRAQIQIAKLKTRYPQGGEKQLIKTLLKKEVPSGGLPYEVGVVVQNVATAAAITEAVKFGSPLIKRVVTVTGSGVKQPKNLLVRIGTTFAEVIEQCGGLSGDAVKVIMGGPMMGIAVATLDLPVVKATSCLLVMDRQEAKHYEERTCIRCGRCLKVCPSRLTPNFLANFIKLKAWEMVEEYNVADCIECGCCSHVCPSRIDLVQYFKLGKSELQTRKAVCR